MDVSKSMVQNLKVQAVAEVGVCRQQGGLMNLNGAFCDCDVKIDNPFRCFVHNLFIAFFQKLYYNTIST